MNAACPGVCGWLRAGSSQFRRQSAAERAQAVVLRSVATTGRGDRYEWQGMG